MATPATVFTSTYQLYKSYTHDVLQWLFIASGFNLESRETAPANAPVKPLPQGSGRLKGKARKLAKESQKDPSARGENKAAPEVVKTPVAVDQLVEMAQSVARNPAEMGSIPKPVIAKLEKTICLRREYLSLYSIRSSVRNAKVDQSIQRENSQHAYFVQVLERVLRILQPPTQQQVIETQSDINSVTDGPSQTMFSTNDFYLLEVEEFDDDGEEDDQIPVATTANLKPKQSSVGSSKDVQQEAVLNEGEQSIEVLFAIYCLFIDIRRIRDLIRDHWQQYKDRKLSLETVTVMSNMSIAAIQKAEQDFLEAFKSHFPEPPNHHELSSLLYNRIASLRGIDPETLHRPEDPYNYEMTDIGDLLLLGTGESLRYLADALTKRGPVACTKRYQRDLDHSQCTVREIDDQEDRLLAVMMFEFANNGSEFISMHDELTLGMHQLYNEKPEPLRIWLVAANKMFVDIHHIMGNDVERAFEELRSAARFADSSITRFLGSRVNKSHSRLWPESNNQELRELQTVMIREHILGSRFNKPLPPCDVSDCSDVFTGSEFRFHKQHPLLSGTQKVFLQLQMQRIGVGVGRAWGSLQFTAHAYNAFRQLGGLDVEWPELEWLIKFYTPEKMFAGHTPTTLDRCYKSFMLQYGVAPSQFACDAGRYKKDTKAGKTMKGSRDWTFPSRTIEIFRNWAMAPGRHSPTEHAGWAVRALAHLLMPEGNSRLKKSRLQDVGPVAQILRVKALFDVEVPCLQFDFLSLHFHCMSFWYEIRSALHSYLVLRRGPDYLIGEENVAQLIGHILQIPANDLKSCAAKSTRRIVQEPNYTIIEGTRVMKKFLLEISNQNSHGSHEDLLETSNDEDI